MRRRKGGRFSPPKEKACSCFSVSPHPSGAAGEEFPLEKNGNIDHHRRHLGGSRFGLHVGLVERHDRSMPEMFDRVYD
jgi:hypothetical protein